MRIIKTNISNLMTAVLCLLLSACAGETAQQNSQTKTSTTESVSSVSSEDNSKYPKHIHPDTSCYKAFIHSHKGGDKEHKHNKRHCDQKAYGNGNAHEHPATDKTGSVRHVHPNGANPHTHH